VQLPLPPHIDERTITMAIDPQKDVDGFHPVNIGKMIIGEKKYTLKFKNGDALIKAMDNLTLTSDQPFLYIGKKYSNLGIMVQEINGIKNDPKNNQYWIYYINGEAAKIGISYYQLKPNDLIEWKFETSKM